MPGLVPGIHAFLCKRAKTWMAGASPAMTEMEDSAMPIFEALDAPNRWRPSLLAAGPFAGLQGGAVASLLTAEVEALAAQRNWGTAIASAAWFLRPTPMADLRSEIRVVSEGGRVSVMDNTLWPVNEDSPCAPVRVTLSRE